MDSNDSRENLEGGESDPLDKKENSNERAG